MPSTMARFRSVTRHIHPGTRLLSCTTRHAQPDLTNTTTTTTPTPQPIMPPPQASTKRPPKRIIGPPINPLDLDPTTVSPQFEDMLCRAGKPPVGSRRRRIAIRITAKIPFERLPYQAFQEARKILAADREKKLLLILDQLDRMRRLKARDVAEISGGAASKEARLLGMRKEVARLKILADSNDPLILKRFQDGLYDLSKPIYRHYLEKKWRKYDFHLIKQRIQQFHIVPDILPKLEPMADTQLYFNRVKTAPGTIVNSLTSFRAPTLRVQVFDPQPRLVTVAVIDPDVPDAATDSFYSRCHYIAVNIPISCLAPSIPLANLRPSASVVVPWQPPHAQKGSPYHRIAIVILEQSGRIKDIPLMRRRFESSRKKGFSVRSVVDVTKAKPFAFTMFRTVWDENTATVMERCNAPGVDIELRHQHIPSLKPPIRRRGWEARRQSLKYRHLWKYTKRLRIDLSGPRPR